jgi:hypothetical protein
VEIWIAKGAKKELRKSFPFIRDFAVIDIREIAGNLGYETSLDLDEHSSFVLSSEIQKRLVALSSSKRFYRVLYLVEEQTSHLAHALLNFSYENELSYEKVFLLTNHEFELFLSLEDFQPTV